VFVCWGGSHTPTHCHTHTHTHTHTHLSHSVLPQWLAKRIEDRTGLEARYVVLGHVLRGGQPCAADRVLAARFGHHAIMLLLAGARNRLVVARNGALHDVEITSAANKQRLVPPTHSLVLAARALLTCFGDSGCGVSLPQAVQMKALARRAVKLSECRIDSSPFSVRFAFTEHGICDVTTEYEQGRVDRSC
jgi:hypothetical protein